MPSTKWIFCSIKSIFVEVLHKHLSLTSSQ